MTNTACSEPTSSTSACNAAAMSHVASSVIIVIRSSGLSWRQTRIALRAPGTNSASIVSMVRRSGIFEVFRFTPNFGIGKPRLLYLPEGLRTLQDGSDGRTDQERAKECKISGVFSRHCFLWPGQGNPDQ